MLARPVHRPVGEDRALFRITRGGDGRPRRGSARVGGEELPFGLRAHHIRGVPVRIVEQRRTVPIGNAAKGQRVGEEWVHAIAQLLGEGVAVTVGVLVRPHRAAIPIGLLRIGHAVAVRVGGGVPVNRRQRDDLVLRHHRHRVQRTAPRVAVREVRLLGHSRPIHEALPRPCRRGHRGERLLRRDIGLLRQRVPQAVHLTHRHLRRLLPPCPHGQPEEAQRQERRPPSRPLHGSLLRRVGDLHGHLPQPLRRKVQPRGRLRVRKVIPRQHLVPHLPVKMVQKGGDRALHIS